MHLDHIGIAVSNSEAASALITKLLGRPPYKTETVTKQGVITTFFEAGADGCKLELVAPAGDEGPVHKFLAKRGPGIHHLAFEVEDIRAEMQRLAADGFQLLQDQPTEGADNKLVCFLHPKTTNGILVEICQTKRDTSINTQDGREATQNSQYWEKRYINGDTGWDIGHASPPIKAYLDQIEDRSLRILIPGAGNAYEAEYAWKQGFKNVHVLDIAPQPLRALRSRTPDFPESQAIWGDFFSHEGQYDLILEQTFFCSFPPTKANRQAYAHKMHELLRPGGKLVGLWFDIPLISQSGIRPFGGTRSEYLTYLAPLFEVRTFTTAHNSIPPRKGRELFGIFQKPI